MLFHVDELFFFYSSLLMEMFFVACRNFIKFFFASELLGFLIQNAIHKKWFHHSNCHIVVKSEEQRVYMKESSMNHWQWMLSYDTFFLLIHSLFWSAQWLDDIFLRVDNIIFAYCFVADMLMTLTNGSFVGFFLWMRFYHGTISFHLLPWWYVHKKAKIELHNQPAKLVQLNELHIKIAINDPRSSTECFFT